jgi:hypothetical protein
MIQHNHRQPESRQTLTGLTYRFRVQASNAVGAGAYSTASSAVTPAGPSVTDPPLIGTAAAGNGQAAVSWTAPASDGGALITGYIVTPYVGYWPGTPRTYDSVATTEVVTGLTNDSVYRFRVQATNAIGASAYSKVTNPVIPRATA